ncbi:rhodanese-like domain-containing protein [Roseateles sp. DB2]|uniref:rhodanese-like domain-containing protein n=1 Tax=Roseateles sp. DB2 TaxID=3453717 RepID=UPI003EE87A54
MAWQLPPTEFSAWLAEVAPQGRPLLLDVREDWEVSQVALQQEGMDWLHIPMNEVPTRLGELEAGRAIVCYCHHGVRSLQVVAFLSARGFDSVYNLAGGIDAWSVQVDPSLPRY